MSFQIFIAFPSISACPWNRSVSSFICSTRTTQNIETHV